MDIPLSERFGNSFYWERIEKGQARTESEPEQETYEHQLLRPPSQQGIQLRPQSQIEHQRDKENQKEIVLSQRIVIAGMRKREYGKNHQPQFTEPMQEVPHREPLLIDSTPQFSICGVAKCQPYMLQPMREGRLNSEYGGN